MLPLARLGWADPTGFSLPKDLPVCSHQSLGQDLFSPHHSSFFGGAFFGLGPCPLLRELQELLLWEMLGKDEATSTGMVAPSRDGAPKAELVPFQLGKLRHGKCFGTFTGLLCPCPKLLSTGEGQ